MLFTLHVYQYRIDKSGGKGGVIGGRSRLHLIDLGSGDKSGGKIVNGVALSYSALGQVVLALLNNAKHIPNRYRNDVHSWKFKYVVKSWLWFPTFDPNKKNPQ